MKNLNQKSPEIRAILLRCELLCPLSDNEKRFNGMSRLTPHSRFDPSSRQLSGH
jgi:hypothetical protein